MAYRLSCVETDEERQKEQSFYGIGLTSRKNLCIHPEVNVTRSPRHITNALLTQETKRNIHSNFYHDTD